MKFGDDILFSDIDANSFIFLLTFLCGIMMLYIPLIVFAVLFGIVHIYLSYKKKIFKQ